ncbi:hypothetical protein DRO69_11085 [Candidatus Bathyarchaeota archaeon]|nr:MAG: hypothetical protein DRO69_11085 [Candidatus Bathyarchaeota archaeon]
MEWEKKRELIRTLVEIYYDVQDVRIRTFNRLRQFGEVRGVNPYHLKRLELEIREYIHNEIKDLPIVKNFLSLIRGIGPILAGGLLSYFDVRKADRPSGFWRYAGLHVVNGRAPRRQRGKKIDWNPKIKDLCLWKLGRSFLMFHTPFYSEIYEKAREIETAKLRNPIENPKNCPLYDECLQRRKRRAERLGKQVKKPACKLHIHYRALRKMVKRFLVDLWVVWRKIEGLPVTKPYAIEKLKHHEIKSPYVEEAEATLNQKTGGSEQAKNEKKTRKG